MPIGSTVNTPNLTYLTKRGILSHGNGSVRDSGERAGARGVLAQPVREAGEATYAGGSMSPSADGRTLSNGPTTDGGPA